LKTYTTAITSLSNFVITWYCKYQNI